MTKKALDVKLSENNTIETSLLKNSQEHQSEIYFETELALLTKTVVDWNYNSIPFKAEQNKDFNQINNYTYNVLYVNL